MEKKDNMEIKEIIQGSCSTSASSTAVYSDYTYTNISPNWGANYPSNQPYTNLSQPIITTSSYGTTTSYTGLGSDMRLVSISEDKVTNKLLGKMMRGDIKVLVAVGDADNDEYIECTLADLLKTGLLKFHQL